MWPDVVSEADDTALSNAYLDKSGYLPRMGVLQSRSTKRPEAIPQIVPGRTI